MLLQVVLVVFGVDDQGLIPLAQGDVGPHGRQEGVPRRPVPSRVGAADAYEATFESLRFGESCARAAWEVGTRWGTQ